MTCCAPWWCSDGRRTTRRTPRDRWDVRPDGGTWDVGNHVRLVGDDDEVVLIDAAHDAGAILAAEGERRLTAVVCTHAHNDQVNAAPEVTDATGARLLLHPDDEVLRQLVPPGQRPDAELAGHAVLDVAGVEPQVPAAAPQPST